MAIDLHAALAEEPLRHYDRLVVRRPSQPLRSGERV
jgi:hypothetical protein